MTSSECEYLRNSPPTLILWLALFCLSWRDDFLLSSIMDKEQLVAVGEEALPCNS
jgi:hypothetical protein